MKDKLLIALKVQSISTGPQRYTFTEHLLLADARATFNQVGLEIGIHTVDNLNKVLLEMAKHETAPLPADEIMNIIYHSMPTMRENKMIEQGCNYADSTIKEMTDFFETKVENLEPKEEKKKSNGKCSYTADKCWDLHAIINKHK